MSRSFWNLMLLALLPAGAIFANPHNPSVAAGRVVFSDSGSFLSVTNQSQRAIVNWESFSVGGGETVQFTQAETAAILNRVTGGDLSNIEGAIRGSGTVFLLNPNGIVVGPTGSIDVGGFLGSTLSIRDEEFLQGGDLRFRDAGEGIIRNFGTIQARNGDVFLLGDSVENAGLISAANGTVGLAAGDQILVKAGGDERVFVEVGSGGSVENTTSGKIEASVAELKAAGGNAKSLAVGVGGVVEATGVERRGGRVFLSAGGGTSAVSGAVSARTSIGNGGEVQIRAEVVEIDETARVMVDGGDGGTVNIVGGSTAAIEGSVSAMGDDGTGGLVKATADELIIGSTAVVEATGISGGGDVLLGGEARGEAGRVERNALRASVLRGAVMRADSLESGDAGRVVVWADEDTFSYGHSSAAARGATGDGGFLEVSGKIRLGFDGTADATSVGGTAGTLILDPTNVTIVAGANGTGANDAELTADGMIAAADGGATDFVISIGALQAAAQNTGVVGIEVANSITFTSAPGTTITVAPDTNVELIATAGTLTATGINFNNASGRVDFRAFGNLTVGDIDTSGQAGGPVDGGNIELFSAIGDIVAGDLDSSGAPAAGGPQAGSGGSISVQSLTGNVSFQNAISRGADNPSAGGFSGNGGLMTFGGLMINALFTDSSGGSGPVPGGAGFQNVNGVNNIGNQVAQDGTGSAPGGGGPPAPGPSGSGGRGTPSGGGGGSSGGSGGSSAEDETQAQNNQIDQGNQGTSPYDDAGYTVGSFGGDDDSDTDDSDTDEWDSDEWDSDDDSGPSIFSDEYQWQRFVDWYGQESGLAPPLEDEYGISDRPLYDPELEAEWAEEWANMTEEERRAEEERLLENPVSIEEPWNRWNDPLYNRPVTNDDAVPWAPGEREEFEAQAQAAVNEALEGMSWEDGDVVDSYGPDYSVGPFRGGEETSENGEETPGGAGSLPGSGGRGWPPSGISSLGPGRSSAEQKVDTSFWRSARRIVETEGDPAPGWESDLDPGSYEHWKAFVQSRAGEAAETQEPVPDRWDPNSERARQWRLKNRREAQEFWSDAGREYEQKYGGPAQTGRPFPTNGNQWGPSDGEAAAGSGTRG